MSFSLRRRITADFPTALAMPDAVARLERYVIAQDEHVDEVPHARLIDGKVAAPSFRLCYECSYGKVIVRGRVRQRRSHTQVSLRFREEPIRLVGPALIGLAALAAWYFLRSIVSVTVDILGIGLPIIFGVTGLFVPRWGTSPGFADAVVAELSALMSEAPK